MCADIGVAPGSVDLDDPRWYLTHSWTLDQQDRFVSRLVAQLRRRRDLREGLMDHPDRRNPHYLRKVAEEFAWNYGWKLQVKEAADEG
jgi:hypothetical protein